MFYKFEMINGTEPSPQVNMTQWAAMHPQKTDALFYAHTGSRTFTPLSQVEELLISSVNFQSSTVITS
ncbi:hypothetical protein FRX31_015068, partial [Thalictrum thalictroides]